MKTVILFLMVFVCNSYAGKEDGDSSSDDDESSEVVSGSLEGSTTSLPNTDPEVLPTQPPTGNATDKPQMVAAPLGPRPDNNRPNIPPAGTSTFSMFSMLSVLSSQLAAVDTTTSGAAAAGPGRPNSVRPQREQAAAEHAAGTEDSQRIRSESMARMTELVEKLNTSNDVPPGSVEQVPVPAWASDTCPKSDPARYESLVRRTPGIQYDIAAAGRDTDSIHVFSVASQYNTGETGSARVAPPGMAMRSSARDRSQGPTAQRMFPNHFEAVNTHLANRAYSMLAGVLSRLSLKALSAGYLLPDSATLLEHVRLDFLANWRAMSLLAYQARPRSDITPLGGDPFVQEPAEPTADAQLVHLVLMSAPVWSTVYNDAASHIEGSAESQDQITTYNSHAEFTALLDYALRLAQRDGSAGRTIHVHIAPVGTGQFGNDLRAVELGRDWALADFSQELSRINAERAREGKGRLSIKITYDVFR